MKLIFFFLFTGLFIDSFGSYVYPFFIPGGILAVVSIAVLIMDGARNRHKKNNDHEMKT